MERVSAIRTMQGILVASSLTMPRVIQSATRRLAAPVPGQTSVLVVLLTRILTTTDAVSVTTTGMDMTARTGKGHVTTSVCTLATVHMRLTATTAR
jgi:hypothetical protein